uniref:Uncharacterized protein n=1 Tax=Setaria viridis TaxID=4556 RepID=A0A4U6U593_SETVI|nr:hypothetical protein SEVIR_6G140066v2 [Setaria viridis]
MRAEHQEKSATNVFLGAPNSHENHAGRHEKQHDQMTNFIFMCSYRHENGHFHES